MIKQTAHAYVTFSLNDEKFAIPVDNVQEIVEFGQVTKVPNAPDYMLGIINLRGQILPLLDTKLKLGLSATVKSKKSRVMVLDIPTADDKRLHIGAVVDVAREVIEISPKEIQEAPDVDDLKSSAPVIGILNIQGDITMIMDIKKVFSMHELVKINASIN
jgi:purine-binding chemotaxis protein CheW